jgi:hypothetical protein
LLTAIPYLKAWASHEHEDHGKTFIIPIARWTRAVDSSLKIELEVGDGCVDEIGVAPFETPPDEAAHDKINRVRYL